MKFAVNYSDPASDLLRNGQIQIDCFKCPAWPDLIASVLEIYPTYVHFPLKVGAGSGDVIDTETNQPVNWDKVERLLNQTETPFVNVHLSPTVQDYADSPVDIPVDTADHAHIEMLTENMINDLSIVVSRFGSNRVIAENIHGSGMNNLRPAYLPEVIQRVVEEADCGLLLDLSHARLAARQLGIDEREYVSALPITRIREIHVTGIQRFEGHWVERIRGAGVDPNIIQPFIGKLVEHLPMTGEDWDFFAWSMNQIHNGVWSQPWVVAFEYGGVSALYEAVTDAGILAGQIPRLNSLVKRSR